MSSLNQTRSQRTKSTSKRENNKDRNSSLRRSNSARKDNSCCYTDTNDDDHKDGVQGATATTTQQCAAAPTKTNTTSTVDATTTATTAAIFSSSLTQRGKQQQQQQLQQSIVNTKATTTTTTTAATTTTTTKTRPRNLFITDATHPLTVQFRGRFGTNVSITVYQTVNEETWPGGAVWDLGWLLGHVVIGSSLIQPTNSCNVKNRYGLQKSQQSQSQLSNRNQHQIQPQENKNQFIKTTTTNWSDELLRYKHITRTIGIPDRVRYCVQNDNNVFLQQSGHDPHTNNRKYDIHHLLDSCSIVLELGCGVGLTGLLAAASIRPKIITILTDLQIVIDKVTKPNVELNSKQQNGQQHANRSNYNNKMGPSTVPSTMQMSISLQQLLQKYTTRILNDCKSPVIALPLCWGNRQDEDLVLEFMSSFVQQRHSSRTTRNTGSGAGSSVPTTTRHNKMKTSPTTTQSSATTSCITTSTAQLQYSMKFTNTGEKSAEQHHSTASFPFPSSPLVTMDNGTRMMGTRTTTATRSGTTIDATGIVHTNPEQIFPDLILIGDVAYQHYPGAPSHFDDLLSTLLKLSNECTVVIFGIRIRMPASIDLLYMLLEHYDEIITPPLAAHEIDPIDFPPPSSIYNNNHNSTGTKYTNNNITMHFLRKKREKNEK